jgi:hypothetical protein
MEGEVVGADGNEKEGRRDGWARRRKESIPTPRLLMRLPARGGGGKESEAVMRRAK